MNAPHAAAHDATADLKANPKLDYIDSTATTAPIYTDGPLPIPGEVVNIPMVRGRHGEPVPVVAVAPSAFIAFKDPDSSPPKKAFVRKHHDDAKAASTEPVVTIPLRAGTSNAGGKDSSWVGFDTPDLPAGVYDVWYEGGSPKVGPGRATSLTDPPKPAARQWTTIEVRASLRAVPAVVRGRLGSTRVPLE